MESVTRDILFEGWGREISSILFTALEDDKKQICLFEDHTLEEYSQVMEKLNKPYEEIFEVEKESLYAHVWFKDGSWMSLSNKWVMYERPIPPKRLI